MNKRHDEFRALVAKAEAAGRAAAAAVDEQMMVVTDGTTVYEPFPICGFAWVLVKPNRGAFANYLKAHAGFRPHYGGGISNWVSDYNQSHDKKAAHARAYAEVLREAGYNAYGESRLD